MSASLGGGGGGGYPGLKALVPLNILKEQGFITGEQQGTWIIFSLTDRSRRAMLCTKRVEARKGRR